MSSFLFDKQEQFVPINCEATLLSSHNAMYVPWYCLFKWQTAVITAGYHITSPGHLIDPWPGALKSYIFAVTRCLPGHPTNKDRATDICFALQLIKCSVLMVAVGYDLISISQVKYLWFSKKQLEAMSQHVTVPLMHGPRWGLYTVPNVGQ